MSDKSRKVVSLCRAVIQKGWEEELRNCLKAESSTSYKIYILTYEYIEKNISIAWDDYIREQWKDAPQKLNDVASNLTKTIERFLQQKYNSIDFEIQQKIELFYIYRDLGLDNTENIYWLKKNISRTSNAYLAFLSTQLQREETEVLTNQRKSNLNTITEAFYLFFIPQLGFDACMQFSKDYTHASDRLSPFQWAEIKALIEKSPILQAHQEISLYSDLWDFIFAINNKKTLSTDEVENFLSPNIPIIANLELTKRRDVIAMIINNLIIWHKKDRTLVNSQVVWHFFQLVFEKEWIFIGGKIDFAIYRIYIKFYIYAHESFDNQNTISKNLLNLEKKYKTKFNSPKESRDVLHFSYYCDWKLRRNLENIYECNAAKFVADTQKIEIQLLKLKAGLCLYHSEQLDNFWDYVYASFKDETVKKALSKSHKIITIELSIWESMMEIYRTTKKKTEAKRKLKQIREEIVQIKTYFL